MPSWSSYSTGERIKILRGKSISQEQLAAMTGLSVATIQAAEQDRRRTFPTLMAISAALGADISVIEGQQPPRRAMDQDDRMMVRALSAAVHDTAAGLLPEAAEPATHDDLRRATALCWEMYWRGHYTEAGATVTPLLVAAAATLRDRPTGQQSIMWGALSDVYRIAAYVANLVGVRDLAYAAIGHARNAAEKGDDALRPALVDSGRAWVYMRDARLDDALRLAEKAATDIEPRFSRATPDELAVYGSHVNFAAVVASRKGDKERAADFLSQSNATGARMGTEHRAHGTLFGPVTATTQAVGINVAMGQTGKALTLIQSIHDGETAQLTEAARNRYAMDKAMAQADAKMWDASLETLEVALRGAPEWARHQTLPSVIAEKVGRQSNVRLARVSKLIGMRTPVDSGFAAADRRTAL
ncbi:helix-turn-helix domain-containing protein [Streptomyces sp. ISL-94]|uniref:helix-turn-helix domain-containing protein n=1 Tax=Streptomyces sp. ISL-94 TaxID=2819190 RepID=UPI001BE52D02|nr:helix-turn-helix transcriptional regulator [Streptomyces sp. ISL-94]MBT2479188.1 helix-turn-helix transcriptional regulator [Streptomyces sp. ISL-94]